MFETAIWDLFAGGKTVEEIKSAIELLDTDLVDEVKKTYDLELSDCDKECDWLENSLPKI